MKSFTVHMTNEEIALYVLHLNIAKGELEILGLDYNTARALPDETDGIEGWLYLCSFGKTPPNFDKVCMAIHKYDKKIENCIKYVSVYEAAKKEKKTDTANTVQIEWIEKMYGYLYELQSLLNLAIKD